MTDQELNAKIVQELKELKDGVVNLERILVELIKRMEAVLRPVLALERAIRVIDATVQRIAARRH